MITCLTSRIPPHRCFLQNERLITNYGIYRHDVKVDHPPKQNPKLWRLPVHRKLVYVSPGWFYRKLPNSVTDDVVKTTTSCVTFSKSSTHKLLESLTKEEFEFLLTNKDLILNEFSKVAEMKPELEKQDQAMQHFAI